MEVVQVAHEALLVPQQRSHDFRRLARVRHKHFEHVESFELEMTKTKTSVGSNTSKGAYLAQQK